MEEIEALIVFNSIAAVFSKKIHRLLSHFESASECAQSSREKWAQALGNADKTLNLIEVAIHNRIWEKELQRAEKTQIHILDKKSSHYPKNLFDLTEPPLLLYAKGDLSVLQSPQVAVVGTRACTEYGRTMAHLLSKQAAQQGVTIVSGLARGIDTAAHQGALEGGKTIAVLGSGLYQIYPRENVHLAETIAQNGCLLSELPLDAPPAKHHFPSRNRIVAALGKGILLIEAPEQSGAMITVAIGHGLGRKCFAIPGRIDYPTFQGSHAIIKQGKAQLVENFFEIASNLQIDKQILLDFKIKPDEDPYNLTSDEYHLFKLISTQEMYIDQVAESVGWPIQKIQSVLMQLVLKKKIKQLSGNLYERVP